MKHPPQSGAPTPDLRAQLQSAVGTTYTLERELGGGGMSRVFLATELALDRPVVLKLLPPELASAVSTDRFRQEIRLAARLQHPHIVPLHSAGEADGLLYYTMPLVDGESLRARLARAGELPVREAVRVLRDVAAALAYAHEHGVVHRDIKPDNVLLTGGEALVTDFGVAKALSAAATPESSGLTSLGVALGTPAYMAPEQGAADPHVDHRADLYAWGCLAYECLTGDPPFTGRTAQALLAAHMTVAPEHIDRRRSGLPPTLSALVMRCLEKRPADRPQSAAELLPVLETVATPSGGMEPTQAVRSLPRVSRPLRRKAMWGAVAAMAVAGVGTAVWTRGSTTPAALDANLVAVAPFDALGSNLGLWSEGFVDLLSRSLDGAGPLRTVPPSVVIRRWTGRADAASVTQLGQGTGAGLAIFGTLVPAGADSVRLSATIFDVANGRGVGEVQLHGDVRRMDRLSDSLTVAILRELGRTRPLAAVRATELRATSLPALKAFLEGEQLYRRGAWDSAGAAYARALAIDSTFVPALLHMGQTLWWHADTDTAYRAYLLKAGAMNRGLGRRDSLLAAADSSHIALERVDSMTPSVRRAIVQRLFGTLNDAVRLYPEDSEVWYLLGEAQGHHGAWHDVTPTQALESFDRAVALDSTFRPAYWHLPDAAAALGDVPEFLRRAQANLAKLGKEDGAPGLPTIFELLSQPAADTLRADSALRRLSSSELSSVAFETYRLADSMEIGVRATRILMAHPDATGEKAVLWRSFYVVNLAARGHLREASRVMAPIQDHDNVRSLIVEMGLLRSASEQSTDSLLRRRLDHGPFWQPAEGISGRGAGALGYGPVWWAARRDTAAIKHFVARADSTARAQTLPYYMEGAEFQARQGGAYLTLARGDTTGALRQLGQLPHDVHWGVFARLTEAQILAGRGEDAKALALVERAFPSYWASPGSVLARLEAARIAERLGQTARAIADYRYVLNIWRHADPELQPYVSEARTAIARLTAERS